MPAVAAAVSGIAFTNLCGIGGVLFVGAYFCSSRSGSFRFTAHTLSALGGAVLAVSFLTHIVVLPWLAWSLCNVGFVTLALYMAAKSKEAAMQSVAVQSKNRSIRSAGLSLYEKLFEQGQGYESAGRVAQAAVQSEDRFVREAGLQLYRELFERGEGYESAALAAEAAVQSEDLEVREAGIELYRELVERGKGYESAKEVAKAAVQSKDRYVREAGILLYGELFEQGQGYESAARVANVALYSEN